MKYNAKISYKEYENSNLKEKYSVLGIVEIIGDVINVSYNFQKKSNINLEFSKKNDIIHISKSGEINYFVEHVPNSVSKIEITIGSLDDMFEVLNVEILTKDVNIAIKENKIDISYTFKKDDDHIKVEYEITFKGEWWANTSPV